MNSRDAGPDGRPVGRGSAVRLQGTDLLRGSVVILAAVLIGLLVMTRALDEPTGVVSAGGAESAADDDGGTESEASQQEEAPAPADAQTLVNDTTTTAAPSTTTTVATTTTDAPATALAPSEVKVLVLNGAEKRGIAQAGSEKLQAAGYVTGVPKNANGRRASAIYFLADRQLEAAAVAEVFEVDPATLVQPYDTGNPPIDDLQDAVVVVVIGEDDVIAV